MTILHACGALGWGFEAAVLIGLSVGRVQTLVGALNKVKVA